MNQCRSYHLQSPKKVAEILLTWEGNKPFKGFHIDDLRLIISIICTHLRKDDKGNIYAQLKMEFLRNKIWNAEKYIQLLISAGIVERIGGYKPEVNSYKYRFTSAYQSPYVTTELKNQKLLRKIYKVNADAGRKDKRQYPKQNQQIKSMTIEFENAVRLSNEKFPNKDQVNKLNYALGAITRIHNKDFYYKVDETGNRYHNPLTNLPKFLKGLIKIMNKYIAGIDIRNCQPLMATKYFTDPAGAKEFFLGEYPLMRLKCLRLTEQQDVKRFLLLTSKAEFYKYLETEFNKRGLFYKRDKEQGIDELKDKIFQILFDKNHHTSKEKRIFFELFPGVEKAFSVLKMDDYKNFVISLQRMESYVVLDVIIKRLNDEHPDMVATPIYDSITTSIATDDIKTVRQVMTEELTKFVGISPVLKVENFSRPHFLTSNSSI
jgi:hypothetical protein